MSTPPTPPALVPDNRRQRFQFTSRTIATATAFTALALALVVQNQRLANVRAALSRYESTTVPVALASGQFRVIVQPVLDVDHARAMKYRIECADERFVTVSGPGHSGGVLSKRDATTGLYITEVTLLVDHLASQNRVKMFLAVGGAQGTTIDAVNVGYAIRDHLSISKADGVYAGNEKATLFMWNGQPFSASVK